MGKKVYSHSNYDKKGGEFKNYKDSQTNERYVDYIAPSRQDGTKRENAVFGPDGFKINTKK